MRDKPLVTVFTCVYNSKQYVEQCIKSVLNQSYKNIQYIIVDNCSTDGADELVKKYAKNDDRIEVFFMKENLSGRFPYFLNNYAKGEYITSIDCDDYLETDYIEKLMNFMTSNDLDIGICGSCFHFMQDGSIGFRKSEQNCIYEKEEIYENFTNIYQFIRTIWGKIYKTKLIKNKEELLLEEISKCRYGIDTLISISALKNTNRIGILEEVLHNYRVHKNSLSYKFNSLRFKADLILYNYAEEFIRGNAYYDENLVFINRVYYASICDTINSCKNSALSNYDKNNYILETLEHEKTLSMFKLLYSGKNNIYEFIYKVNMILNRYCDITFKERIVKCIYNIITKCVPEANQWLQINELENLLLNYEALNNLLNKKFITIFVKDFHGNIDKVKESFIMFCRLNPILDKIENNQFYLKETEIVNNILIMQYEKAICDLMDIIKFKDVSLDHILILEYLSSITKNVEIFIYSKKIELYFWTYSKNIVKAEEVLNELKSMIIDEEYLENAEKEIRNI